VTCVRPRLPSGRTTLGGALIYQHATSQRDREIADALQKLIEREPTAVWPVRGPRSFQCQIERRLLACPIRAQ
jgi:hypothetical protein